MVGRGGGRAHREKGGGAAVGLFVCFFFYSFPLTSRLPRLFRAWETPKSSVRTEHYRRSLLSGLAPSMGPTILIVVIFLLATVVGCVCWVPV